MEVLAAEETQARGQYQRVVPVGGSISAPDRAARCRVIPRGI